MKIRIMTCMFLALLVACSVMQSNRDLSGINNEPSEVTRTPIISVASPPDEWYQRWLEKTPCAAPCWEGITPGITTANEAEKILKTIPYIYGIRITPQIVPGMGVIGWKTSNNIPSQLEYRSNDKQNEVTEIDLYFQTFTLGQIIAAYGEPSHIIAQAIPPPDINQPLDYGLRIIYLNYGIILSGTGDLEVKPQINFDSQFNVRFFIPTTDGFKETTGIEINDKAVRKWEGYKDFDVYCTDVANGYYCQGGHR